MCFRVGGDSQQGVPGGGEEMTWSERDPNLRFKIENVFD